MLAPAKTRGQDSLLTPFTSGGRSRTPQSSQGTDYKSIIANLAQSLMPGGDIEKSQIAEATEEGKSLSAQLNAAAISKGLGNATGNAPVTAAKHVAKRKQEIRGGLLQQLLQTMQFLANMSSQEEQNAANRVANAGPTNAQRGLSELGTPSLNYGLNGSNLGGGFSAQAFPSLASAGGMSASTEPARATTPIADVFGGDGSTETPSFAGGRKFGDPFFINGRDVTKPG